MNFSGKPLVWSNSFPILFIRINKRIKKEIAPLRERKPRTSPRQADGKHSAYRTTSCSHRKKARFPTNRTGRYPGLSLFNYTIKKGKKQEGDEKKPKKNRWSKNDAAVSRKRKREECFSSLWNTPPPKKIPAANRSIRKFRHTSFSAGGSGISSAGGRDGNLSSGWSRRAPRHPSTLRSSPRPRPASRPPPRHRCRCSSRPSASPRCRKGNP